MILCPSHPLPRLLMVRRENLPCASLASIPSINLPSTLSTILTWFLHITPQDIKMDAPAKDSQSSGKSPKAGRPPTPDVAKIALETLEPPSPSEAWGSPSPATTQASSPKDTPNSSSIGAPLSFEPAESPKTTPPSPWSYILSFAGGVPLGGDSIRPQPKDIPQCSPRIAETLAKEPKFIKVIFHIGRFIMVVVDTEADCANIEALRTDLDSVSTQIHVSAFFLIFHYRPYLILTSSPLDRN
jgi:hypothetical protein